MPDVGSRCTLVDTKLKSSGCVKRNETSTKQSKMSIGDKNNNVERALLLYTELAKLTFCTPRLLRLAPGLCIQSPVGELHGLAVGECQITLWVFLKFHRRC